MGQFRVEWDDFSGGFFVGPNDADQPRNTWTGTGMTVSADQAMLMPAGAVTLMSPGGTAEEVSIQNFQQFGAPIVCSGWLNGATPVRQLVVWAADHSAGSAPDYDVTFFSCDGVTAHTTVIAGSSGDFYFPTGRPVAAPLAANYAVSIAWFPLARNVGGVFTYFICAFGTNAITATTYSIPVRLHILARWKEWVVGNNYAIPNRLHFSAPLDPSSWSASDYVAIGDESPITAIVPMANQIWVGKQQGWYIVTGVLGESTTVRPMDSRMGPSSFGAEPTDEGIMFARSDQGVSLVSQRGMKTGVVNHTVPASRTIEYQNPIDVSSGVIIAGGGPQSFDATAASTATSIYAWVYVRGRWSKIALPGGAGVEYMWAKDHTHIQVGEEYAWLLRSSMSGTTSAAAALFRHPLNLTDPPASVSATATLSEWRRQNSGSGPLWFTVVEAIAEIEVPPSTAGSYSLGCVMRGVPDRVDTGTSYPTTPETVSFSSGSRRTVTVRTSVGSSHGNGVEPVVTLTGCKLRRLTLVCADAGQP